MGFHKKENPFKKHNLFHNKHKKQRINSFRNNKYFYRLQFPKAFF